MSYERRYDEFLKKDIILDRVWQQHSSLINLPDESPAIDNTDFVPGSVVLPEQQPENVSVIVDGSGWRTEKF